MSRKLAYRSLRITNCLFRSEILNRASEPKHFVNKQIQHFYKNQYYNDPF